MTAHLNPNNLLFVNEQANLRFTTVVSVSQIERDQREVLGGRTKRP